jgi:hypothetical protein
MNSRAAVLRRFFCFTAWPSSCSLRQPRPPAGRHRPPGRNRAGRRRSAVLAFEYPGHAACQELRWPTRAGPEGVGGDGPPVGSFRIRRCGLTAGRDPARTGGGRGLLPGVPRIPQRRPGAGSRTRPGQFREKPDRAAGTKRPLGPAPRRAACVTTTCPRTQRGGSKNPRGCPCRDLRWPPRPRWRGRGLGYLRLFVTTTWPRTRSRRTLRGVLPDHWPGNLAATCTAAPGTADHHFMVITCCSFIGRQDRDRICGRGSGPWAGPISSARP